MKKRSVRLKVVLELAERKEQAAMDVLQSKRRYLDQQQQQLQSLQSYHQQYLDDMKLNMKGSVAVKALQLSQEFMSQIAKAIDQQQGTLRLAEQEFDYALKAWGIVHHKRKGMFDLIARYRSEENLQAEKHAQKLLESDFTASRFRI